MERGSFSEITLKMTLLRVMLFKLLPTLGLFSNIVLILI